MLEWLLLNHDMGRGAITSPFWWLSNSLHEHGTHDLSALTGLWVVFIYYNDEVVEEILLL